QRTKVCAPELRAAPAPAPRDENSRDHPNAAMRRSPGPPANEAAAPTSRRPPRGRQARPELERRGLQDMSYARLRREWVAAAPVAASALGRAPGERQLREPIENADH